MLVRPLTKADVGDCLAICRKRWGDQMACTLASDIGDHFSMHGMPTAPIFVVAETPEVFGFACSKRISASVWGIWWLTTSENGTGAGRRMMEYMMASRAPGRVAIATRIPDYFEHCWGFKRLASNDPNRFPVAVGETPMMLDTRVARSHYQEITA